MLADANRERRAEIETLTLDPVAVHTLDQPDVGAEVVVARSLKNTLGHNTWRL